MTDTLNPQLTTFSEAVLSRLTEYARSAHLSLWTDDYGDMHIANREIALQVKDYKKATIRESIYCNGTKRAYFIAWYDNGACNELDLHDYYCCYKTGPFIGIWDYHHEEEAEA